MSRQDPDVKNNPFSAQWDEQRHAWLVQSASGKGHYEVDPETRRCSCEAPVACWHAFIVPLADELASVQASARSYYAGWRLADLRAEDARLRAIVDTADGPAWFDRAQYAVVGEAILDRLIADEWPVLVGLQLLEPAPSIPAQTDEALPAD